jgi:haloalkane dehalogenase
LIPHEEDAPGAEIGRNVLSSLGDDGRPKLILWASGDFILPPKVGKRVAEVIGAPAPELIEGASHFLQEDKGEEIGARIAAWLSE